MCAIRCDIIIKLTNTLCFFESTNNTIQDAEDKDSDKDENEKRGRGSRKQAKVLAMVESKEVAQANEKYKHKTNKKVGFFKNEINE